MLGVIYSPSESSKGSDYFSCRAYARCRESGVRGITIRICFATRLDTRSLTMATIRELSSNISATRIFTTRFATPNFRRHDSEAFEKRENRTHASRPSAHVSTKDGREKRHPLCSADGTLRTNTFGETYSLPEIRWKRQLTSSSIERDTSPGVW